MTTADAFSDGGGTRDGGAARDGCGEGGAARDGGAARRRNRSSAQVRRNLLDTAARLVRERGVATVTYRDIAAAAGTSDSVLLRHFGTKNELIVAAVIEPFTAALRELADAARSRREEQPGPGVSAPDPIGSRRMFLAGLHEILSANRSVVRILLAAEASGTADPVLTPALARLRLVLDALADAGPEPPLTARVVIAMAVSVAALDDVLFPMPGGPPSPDALVTALAALATHGRAGPE
jgi:AcrR family transcriptional regulator